MGTVRVFLAYSHEIIRKGLVACLEGMPDIELIGVCEYARNILAQARQLKPDVILLDGNIVGVDFLEVVRQLREELPETRIIIVTPLLRQLHDPLSYLDSRADAYIDLDIDTFRIYEVINSVYGGAKSICPMIAEALLKKASSADNRNETEQPFLLTRREIEILACVAKGQSNREIAASLFVSDNTVKAHLQNILRKMKVRTRAQAAIVAREQGILSDQKL